VHGSHLTTAIAIREPAGERQLALPLLVGAADAAILVPGVTAPAQLQISWEDSQWRVTALAGAQALLDGQPLRQSRELRSGDVIGFGAAQLRFSSADAGARLDVLHLAGNDTIAPLDIAPVSIAETSDEEVEIRAAGLPVVRVGASEAEAGATAGAASAAPRRRLGLVAAALLLALVTGVMFALQAVPVDVSPVDAQVSVPGSLLHWHSGNRLFVLPGKRTVRATRTGYFPQQVVAQVDSGKEAAPLRLHLARRPGVLDIDTGGLAVSVLVDGEERGHAPGKIEVPAGKRLVLLRAPRHLDFTQELEIEGAGAQQALSAKLQPSWGRVEVVADPVGARVLVDRQEAGTTPAKLELDAGVHEISVEAPARKSWQSRIALRAGESLALGPLVLGQPDAVVAIRSSPAGADVNITGAYRGRTPVQVELPGGAAHDVVVSLAGYRNWSRNLRPVAGARSSLDARLEPVLVEVSVTGEPAGAELLVDGEPRGRTPQTLQLPATAHHLQLRKEGFAVWETTVTPAEGMARQVQYTLITPAEEKRGAPLAPQLASKAGVALRLIPLGSFQMGSERREQGRRPNEGSRRVTFTRAFYLGVNEITNAQYHGFRAEHVSGFVDKQTLDLDAYPVTGVSWDEAAEFCNWLSQQDALPLAYERKDGHYVLIQPANTGYRLPTEAEWEYAARYVDGRSAADPAGGGESLRAGDTAREQGSEEGRREPRRERAAGLSRRARRARPGGNLSRQSARAARHGRQRFGMDQRLLSVVRRDRCGNRSARSGGERGRDPRAARGELAHGHRCRAAPRLARPGGGPGAAHRFPRRALRGAARAMKHGLLALLVIFAACAGSAGAAQPPAALPATPPAATPPAAAEAPKPATPPAEAAPPADAATPADADAEEDLPPGDKGSADNNISFPVDI
jgi:formylglycine-generating enzyme required for sulfatase activity